MLSSLSALLLALTILISSVRPSVPSPKYEASKAVASISGPLDQARLHELSSVQARPLEIVGATLQTYTRTRRTDSQRQITLKLFYRGPNSQVLPIRGVAVALHAFYTAIAHSVSTMGQQSRSATNIFTLTQGPLQLTMSGLGTAVPWDFVQDWSSQAAERVARGWTDTFDAIYEAEGTGQTVWVSLRLLV